MSLGESVWETEKIEWILGPKFLWEPKDTWNTNTKTPDISPEDPELRKVVHVNQIIAQTDVLSVLENHA